MFVFWLSIYFLFILFSLLIVVNLKKTLIADNLYNNLFFKNIIILILFLVLFCVFFTTTENQFLINTLFLHTLQSNITSEFLFFELFNHYTLLLPFLYSFLFITFMTLTFTFTFNKQELNIFTLFLFCILLASTFLFFTNSLIMFFFFYEALLLPSFLILYRYAKTRKAVEAAFLMFFWTQFGALFLIFAFQYLIFISGSTKFSSLAYVNFSNSETYLLFMLFFVGFGVKFPIWPFYEWLPKAHVEASTNFSIFLSGVLVKLAFFGFYKCLINLNSDLTFLPAVPFLIVGLVDSIFKIFYQIDLKKIIAYSTVIEMHWLTISLLLGSNVLWHAAAAMILSHALLSSALFLLIDYTTRRFKTRLITEISGIVSINPDIYVLTIYILVVFLGFPGTLFFYSEFLFFSFLLDFNFFIFIFIFFFIYLLLPVSFIHSWFRLLFGQVNPITLKITDTTMINLSFTEKAYIYFILLQLFLLGFNFQFIFF